MRSTRNIMDKVAIILWKAVIKATSKRKKFGNPNKDNQWEVKSQSTTTSNQIPPNPLRASRASAWLRVTAETWIAALRSQ